MPPLSFSTITPGNFELSPCRVTLNGVDLGATLGNVIVKIEDSLAELKSDQLGSTVIDKKVSGFKMTIDTELAETQLKANWKVVFPAHKLLNSGLGFYFDSEVGASMASFAAPLILHPLSHANADLSGDIKVWLATAESKSEYELSPSAQNKLKITWMVYPDFTTTPPRFAFFGDPANGLVAASAAAAVAGTGNTGNGTVGSIVAYSAYTKTETITLLCETAGASARFFVSGSLSGALGMATNGVTFNSNEISFLITAGGTNFALNDSFTIATTAANYS